MGNACLKSKKKVTLVMVGLDNAGKTTAAKGLVGECPADVAPTFGFSSFELRRDNFYVTLYDLGGSRSIRGIWRNYLAESFGFVFVVDASDRSRATESRDVLHDLLKHPTVSGKPFLILANKQDVEGALDDVELVGLLEVEPLANETKCRTRVEICSALYGASNGKKPDRHIQSGFKWLLTTIGLEYDVLKERVEKDVAVQRQNEAVALRERTERVAKLREERSTVEEAALSASQEEPTPAEIREFLNGVGPFKPISTIVKQLESRNDPSESTLVATSANVHTVETSMTSAVSPTFKVIRVASADVEDDDDDGIEEPQTHDISSRKDELVEVCSETAAGIDRPVSGSPSCDDVAAVNDKDDDDMCLPWSPSKVPSSIMGTDNKPIELDKSTKSRKRRIFSRYNKTSPSPTKGAVVLAPLAPLIMKTGQQGNEALESRHTGPNGFKLSWGLAEELEILESSRLPQVS